MQTDPESLVSCLGLDPAVASAFYGRFARLQPHQYTAAETLLSGQNLVLCAATGSGKSEAVLAPLISRFRQQAAQSQAITWLYLAPTRALLNDMAQRLSLQTQALGLPIGLRHGDHNDLSGRRRPQLLLTTPESLEVLLLHGSQRLQQVKAVIVDEAHLFFHSQRGLQLGSLLQRLAQRLQAPLQWAALSATLAEPVALRDFLFGPAVAAQFISLPGSRRINAQIRCIAQAETLIQLLRQLLLAAPTKILCFCLSRRRCENLAAWLQSDPLLRPLVMTHYASLAAPIRQAVEARFARQRSAICLATTTLELGIDIGDVDAVMLWEPPDQLDSFLQQLGRGNRRHNKQNLIALASRPVSQGWVQVLGFLAWLHAARQHAALPSVCPEIYGAAVQQLPFCCWQDPRSGLTHWVYLTCAGGLINALLASWSGRHCLQQDALALVLSGPVDWQLLPEVDWPQASDLLAVWPGERTRYQQLLPLDLQAAECFSFWQAHPLNRQIVQRLRQAEAVEIPVDILKQLNPDWFQSS